ncbi:MAG: hypothetical protein JF593_12825 [Novosphingobium sp.]|nr:hypothetical protein [Novosphingobium sp.]
MPRFDLLRRPQPFIGVLLVAGGWALSHQVGSNGVFDACARQSGGYVVIVSLLGLILTIIGGLYALRAWRGPAGSGRSFLGLVGALLALLAGFAILLQIAAGLILPTCFG